MTLQQTATLRLRALVATKNALLATKQAHVPVMVMAGLALASPAGAQTIDLSPVQTVLQSIVTAITGPLGVTVGTLAIIGLGMAWLFGYIDFSKAAWTLVGIVLVAAAPTVGAALFSGGGGGGAG